jgi:hypothetical protein
MKNNVRKEKVILKFFDSHVSEEKKPHKCSTCAVYKREIQKGNLEALEFFKNHINDIVKRNNGATIVLDKQNGMKMLSAPAQKGKQP